MDTKNNSTSAPADATFHPVDVMADLADQIICLRGMVGFAQQSVEVALGWDGNERNAELEQDVIASVNDIARRVSQIEQTVRDALDQFDRQFTEKAGA